MDVYIKAKPKSPRKKANRFTSLLSTIFFLVGILMIGQAVLPIVGWYFMVLPGVSQKIISPLASTFPTVVRAQENESYTPSKWFVGQKEMEIQTTNPKVYTLSIPKINIKDANVETGGEDLKKALIGWPTSAAPGTFGNNIIFGHSELPQFANPKDYSGIFTRLMDLEKGDEMYLDFDQVRYKYLVFEKKVVDPSDLSVLEQRFDNGYLTLITCVPPGTVWKRGVIKGKLSSI